MLTLHDTVNIAGHWLPALVNGDITGLEDNEIHQIEDWQSALPPYYKVYDYDYQSVFATDNVSGLKADCYEVNIYIDIDD